MIEPTTIGHAPIVDELTTRVTAAYRGSRTPEDYCYKGMHFCKCHASSDNRDHYIGGLLTNSLCIHYVACHRDEIPEAELEKIQNLPLDFCSPTMDEIQWRSTGSH